MSKFVVYDDLGSVLARFESEASALQYVQNNNDIAYKINDSMVVEATLNTPYITETIPTPANILPLTQQTRVKALTAKEAIAEIKASQANQVQDIITALVAYEGYLEMDKPHKYVTETLTQLGYIVEFTAAGIVVKVEAEID